MFRVCVLTGEHSPSRLVETISLEDFQAWEQYLNQEPWGPLRDDLRAAANTVIANGAFEPGQEPPSFVWPYWPTEDALQDRIQKHREAVAAVKRKGLLGG